MENIREVGKDLIADSRDRMMEKFNFAMAVVNQLEIRQSEKDTIIEMLKFGKDLSLFVSCEIIENPTVTSDSIWTELSILLNDVSKYTRAYHLSRTNDKPLFELID